MVDYEVLDSNDETSYTALFVVCGVIKEEKWKNTMSKRIKSVEKNDTWELTTLLQGHNNCEVKQVYKMKLKKKDEVNKYKAGLVTNNSGVVIDLVHYQNED